MSLFLVGLMIFYQVDAQNNNTASDIQNSTTNQNDLANQTLAQHYETIPGCDFQRARCLNRCDLGDSFEARKKEGQLCFCDSMCKVLGDCCFDFEQSCPSITTLLKWENLECVDVSGNPNHYVMIFKCKNLQYSHPHVYEHCINSHNYKHFMNFVPLYDQKLQISYKNAYCAYCSASLSTTHKSWSLNAAHCLRNASKTRCQLDISPPENVSALMCIPLHQAMKTNDSMTSLCQSYAMVVTSSDGMEYRNPICYLLTGGDIDELTCKNATEASAARRDDINNEQADENLNLKINTQMKLSNPVSISRSGRGRSRKEGAQQNQETEITCKSRNMHSGITSQNCQYDVHIDFFVSISEVNVTDVLQGCENDMFNPCGDGVTISDIWEGYVYITNPEKPTNNTLVTTVQNQPCSGQECHAWILEKVKHLEHCVLVKLDKNEYTILLDGSLNVTGHTSLYSEELYMHLEDEVYVCLNLTMETVIPDVKYLNTDEYELQDFITKVGCILSCAFLFFLLLTYIIFKKLRTLSGKILMNLSIALMTAQLVFVAGVEYKGYSSVCTLIALTLHYSYLASFIWMSVMSYHVAKTFVKPDSVNNCMKSHIKQQKEKKFMVFSLIAWGVPAVFVGICLILDQTEVVDFRYSKDDACWITNQLPLLLFFALPIGIVICFNGYALIRTAIVINKSTKFQQDFCQPSCTNIQRLHVSAYLKLSTVMGLTWVFGFLASIDGASFLWYPFIVFNTLQGVFIFLAFTVTRRIYRMYMILLFGRDSKRKPPKCRRRASEPSEEPRQNRIWHIETERIKDEAIQTSSTVQQNSKTTQSA